MHPSRKNYAFIDSQNLNLAIRAQGWKLDFKRFRVYLRDKYHVETAYLFSGLLKFKHVRPFLRYMNGLRDKLKKERTP